MAHTYTTCPNGHGGPNVLQSLGWEGSTNQVRCSECNSVFDIDHSGNEPVAEHEQTDESSRTLAAASSDSEEDGGNS